MVLLSFLGPGVGHGFSAKPPSYLVSSMPTGRPWANGSDHPGYEVDLIAVLLVTATTKGVNVVFRWPPKPRIPTRFSRPKPVIEAFPRYSLVDASYSAANALTNEQAEEAVARMERQGAELWNDEDYTWHRPKADISTAKPTSSAQSKSNLASGSTSGSESPTMLKKPKDDRLDEPPPEVRGPSSIKQWEACLGYDTPFLAELLSPRPAMCHQKFELFVDELAFIGHPVHEKADESWAFDELGVYDALDSPQLPDLPQFEPDERGRIQNRSNGLFIPSRSISQQQPRRIFQLADDGEEGDTEEPPTLRPPLVHSKTSSRSINSRLPGISTSKRPLSRMAPAQLKSFHLVLVLDRPDPSSLASADLDRYIDGYYTQFAFKLTAAMLYEQARSNFIAREAHMLINLRDKCMV